MFTLAIALGLAALAPPVLAEHRGNPRIFILMVWDGLRPDLVTQHDTPNLFELARRGVRFDRQHSVFPTVTMVNAAALATGAPPGLNGILGNVVYLGPALQAAGASLENEHLRGFANPVSLESTGQLAAANAADGFDGRLLGLDTIAQEVAREGGYIAVVGKTGPTFMFDNRVETVTGGRDLLHEPHENYLFVSDDYTAAPSDVHNLLSGFPPRSNSAAGVRQRDAYLTRIAANEAIPAAKRAIDGGHPALIVLWMHNPDITQHLSGLGTADAIAALADCDTHLATIRAAVVVAGIEDRTDLMVVSDHGFATIQLRLSLESLLVSAGLKKSADSGDVTVAAEGGSDLIYLSPTEFKTQEQRRERLQKIVDFCEAQEWCGPIFSREPAPTTTRRRGAKPYLGWIDGTFAQSPFGLLNPLRSPDLVISFRENPDLDNRNFTGPDKPAFALGAKGQQLAKNNSQELVRPVKGTLYADIGRHEYWTTGMGMHGAVGNREIHNFCAADGPDFKRGFVDRYPTSNIDVAPTIAQVLGVLPNVGPGGIYPSGRATTEALAGGRSAPGVPHAMTATADLMLQGVESVTTLKLTRMGDRLYLDDSTVERKPLGSSP